MINTRPYTALDLQACLRLFDGNVPKFFDPSERQSFATFLQDQSLNTAFLVIENNGVVIACGGHVLEDDGQTAGLCWGMVDQSLHGQGLGRLLTEARLRAIRKQPAIQRVRLDTSQHICAFYARFGFTVERVETDGYGPGLDRHDMVLLL